MDLELPQYKLNHSKPIVGYGNFSYNMQAATAEPMIDKTIVEKKIKIWLDVVNSGILENGTDYEKAKAYSLLNDKTLFAFVNLKMNMKPFRARWMQDVILSDEGDRILFCGCNQFLGKSTTLDVDATVEFAKDHGKGWIGLLISNSLGQSEHRMSNIKELLRAGNLDYQEEETSETKTGKKDNATKISYTYYDKDGTTPLYKNLLICCPHTSSALGYPADNIWLDEIDFWEDVRGGQKHFIKQVIIPRTFFTKGKIKAYSNPNGKLMMWDLWNEVDEDGKPIWHRYHFNYWDSDNPSQREFNLNKVDMTKFQIESTLLAIFSNAEGSFLTHEEIYEQIDDELNDKSGEGRETAWFLDVGVVHDQCVLSGCFIEKNRFSETMPLLKIFYVHKYPVGYPISRVIGIDTAIDVNDGWDDYAQDNPTIKQVMDKYSSVYMGKKEQPVFAFDATSNEGLTPLFATVGIDCTPIKFSGGFKWSMYERLQAYSQQRLIKRAIDRDQNTVANKDASYQLTKLIVKKTQNKSYRTVHHENEDDFDDCPDTFAALCYLHTHPDTRTLSYDIINNQGSVKEEVEKEIKRQEEFTKSLSIDTQKKLEGQYVPSFMRNNEFASFIEKKESEYR